ncbi:MAG: glmM [Gammaproteobacteria bacterium]|jgi:phosphoglucosamine mutase|nr:glmM [Gammaproteobacteria bacterium]
MKQERQFFGTDGIRGCVGKFPITADFVLKLGWAMGQVLQEEIKEASKTILIGKDTRISGYMFESALEAGITSAGVNIALLGPMPTSAVAYLTRTLHAQIGIVISASHNGYNDNGIKFFSSEGYKLPEKWELAIESYLTRPMQTVDAQSLGKAWRIRDAGGRYIEFCKSSIPHHASFENLKLVIDCANGATYHIAPSVFQELGAKVTVIYATPDGLNINENCGSTHPSTIQHHVLKEKADVGIAFDGDGDRVIMVDHLGEILDGDEVLYVIIKGLIEADRLKGGVVGTFMTNKGLEVALQEMGVPFLRVPVGEQYVIEALIKKDWLLGGESSGHIIDRRVTTTDDGIIAALQVLQSMHVTGKSLHELKRGFKKIPQRLVNVKCDNNIDLNQIEIVRALKEAEAKLGKTGRVLLRKSGTEPVIRIMVESDDIALVETLIDSLKIAVESAASHVT